MTRGDMGKNSCPFELAQDFLNEGRENVSVPELVDYSKSMDCRRPDVLFFICAPWQFGPSEVHELDHDMTRARAMVAEALPGFPLPPVRKVSS